jgi:type IV pilus assembly protein PilE
MSFQNTFRRAHGFSLIELLVALAIIAILARVAYPSYVEHLNRAKRAEGKTALLKAAQLQERNYVASSTYVDTAGLATLFSPGYAGTIYSGENPQAVGGNYTITVNLGVGGQDFTLIATPNAAANFNDPKCGNLTLTSAGVQSSNGTLPVRDCWAR